MISDLKTDSPTARVQKWADKTKKTIQDSGLEVHKEVVAEALPLSLGATIVGRPYTVRAAPAKVRLLVESTLHLLTLV